MDPERVLDPIHAASSTAAAALRHCLGSRRRDLLALVLLALVVLVGSPFLAVYHHVTLMELSVMRIEPDGRRTTLSPPPSVWNPEVRARAARRPPATAISGLEARIQRLMRSHPPIAAAPPGTRFEWTIRYSENSARLDRTAVHVYTVPADGPR